MSNYPWASQTAWPLDLHIPPRLHALGFGFHGDVPRERYRLRGLWCIHLYRYVGEAVIDGQSYPIHPGFASVTPADTDLEHVWLHPGSVHISAHFAISATGTDIVMVSAMQDLGTRATALYDEMTCAIGDFPTERRRAEAVLWRVLWLLSDASEVVGSTPALHPAVRQVLQTIEASLAKPLSVAHLANACELSHNQLTHLFRAQVGDTVVGYIVRRRLERASHLLTRSTMPIKAVAAQVGIPDLQQFNKTVRHATGLSPRQVRETSAQTKP